MKFNISVNQIKKLDKGQLSALNVLEKLNDDNIIVVGLDNNRNDNPLGAIISNKQIDGYEFLVNRKGIPGFNRVGISKQIDLPNFLFLTKKFLDKHPNEYFEQDK